ncbi:MAG: signal peptidase I [Planctomycetales bacterium]|nr:signal peptidase I [Planctomycetales bacterium]
MTARKSRGKSHVPAVPSSRQEKAHAPAAHGYIPSPAAIRETIESVAIAFVLAFLFRTFETEAFVIPTGSMAPTLMGRHKDLECPQCGCPYQLSASNEVHPDGAPRRNRQGGPVHVTAGTCPMCRYTDTNLSKDPSYNGDRILVGKLIYQFHEPRRWDVIVFKFPGDGHTDSQTNFIKRLIGLPGETVRIRNGDIWIRRGDEAGNDFHIERKPADKLPAMLQPVFDNRYMPPIANLGWPERWRPQRPDAAQGVWSCDDYVTFQTDGTAAGENWLRYEHRVPSFQQWKSFLKNGEIVAEEVEPRWITDFMAYDTSQVDDDNPEPPPDSLGRHWVGDLALCCTVDVRGETGELIFDLCKGGRRFRCRIDVSTGRATLSVSGDDMMQFRPTATTAVRGPGRHDIRFSNCDNQMLLWVDGRLVSFDSTTAYDEELGNTQPDESDMKPVGVASVGVPVEIGGLQVLRDIYYIAVDGGAFNQTHHDVLYRLDRDGNFRVREPFGLQPYVEFSLETDQFFVLGDNSAYSKDGRLWGADNNFVPRELLIGKALFIYWPHSWDRIPCVNVPFPFFPNFKDMGLVR